MHEPPPAHNETTATEYTGWMPHWLRSGLRDARRYVTVGAGAALTDLGTYTLLSHVFLFDPPMANLISRPLGGLVSFTFNKAWTFRHRSQSGVTTQFVRFWVVWAVSFSASQFFVWLNSHVFGLGAIPTKLIAEGLVGCGTFLAQRHWTFR